MSDAKDEIVNTIAGMLFDDRGSEMGHAMSMLGVYTLRSDDNGEHNDYLGASMSGGYVGGDSMLAHQVHIITFDSWMASYAGPQDNGYASPTTAAEKSKQESTGFRNAVVNPYESDDPALIETAKQELDNAQQDLTTKTTDNGQAQAALQQATTAMAAAQAGYNAENEKLTNLQKNLTTDQTAAQNAAASYAAFKNGKQAVDAAQTALTAAQTTLQTKQATQTAKQTVVNNAQNDLTTKQAAAASAQTALNNAQVAVAAQQNALTAARANVTTAQTALDNAQQDLVAKQGAQQAAQKNVANYSASEATKQQEVAAAQTALQAAQDTLNKLQASLTAKQQGLVAAQHDQAEKAQTVTAAQKALAGDQQLLQNFKDNFSALQNAAGNLAAAQQDLAAKQAALTAAQSNLMAAQSKQTELQRGVAAAQTAKEQEERELQTANSNLNVAQRRYAAALEAMKTAAQKYGDKVALQDITLTAGDPVPAAPTLLNPLTAVSPAEESLLMALAQVPEAALPAGTTAAWGNYAQLIADSRSAGDYQEDVTVAFPDGSSVRKGLTMHVNARKESAEQHGDSSTGVGQSGKQAVQSTPADGQSVVSVVNRISEVRGVSHASVTATVETGVATGQVTSRPAQGAQRQLPQTGNGTEDWSLIGLVTLAFTGLLGLRKRQD